MQRCSPARARSGAPPTCRRRRPRCSWGRLPCATDAPVLRIAPGTEVTIDTVSHEGLLDDQGSDPLAFFTSHGVAPATCSTDAIEIVGTLTRDRSTTGRTW